MKTIVVYKVIDYQDFNSVICYTLTEEAARHYAKGIGFCGKDARIEKMEMKSYDSIEEIKCERRRAKLKRDKEFKQNVLDKMMFFLTNMFTTN